KSLLGIRREDVEAYLEFARKPPRAWVGERNVPRYLERQGERVPNPDWRPYVRNGERADTLSQSGVQAVFAVLSSFFNFLIQEEYAEFNPVAQIRQKSKFLRKGQNARPIRRLSELQWSCVLEAAEELAAADPLKHERTLFIM